MKTCENCQNQHDGKIGSGRFCSLSCSRSFSTKNKRKEINEKVSKTLSKPTILEKCICCGKDYILKKKNQKTCSVKCGSIERWKDENYRIKMSGIASKSAIKKHADPDISFGWRKRIKFEMSYPERIANSVLCESEIEYEYEYPIHPYFIDFAILKYKIAIEIDGQQHLLPDRIEKDKKKDILLLSKGWTVYRIQYPSQSIKESIKVILASIPSA